MLDYIIKPYNLVMRQVYEIRMVVTSYPTIVTAILFLVYLLLLGLAYLLGKKHGISYKKYSKDIIRHNAKLKRIARTCRTLNILDKRTSQFTKIICVFGILCYSMDLGSEWSRNYQSKRNLVWAGFEYSLLL